MIEVDIALEILRILKQTDYNKSMVGINSELNMNNSRARIK